ncbi:MAG: HAD family hydrolase [Clostridiaceae bacterium]
MKKFDTVIFDLDGTLLNTLDDLTDSVNYALSHNGIPCRKKEEIRKFLGNGAAILMERSIPEGSKDPKYGKCLSDFRGHYICNMQKKTGPFDGIMELLEKLSKENFKLAIVSNKFDKAVKGLNKTYFTKYITIAIGESEHIAKKPAPDTVLKAIAELGSTADKTIYIGDSEVDIETARNSGTKCVCVTWGFRDREFLEHRSPDYIIDNPMELIDILIV